MQIIITSQAEAAVIALNEIQKLDPAARGFRLSAEVQVVSVTHHLNDLLKTIKAAPPIFIRHMFPVQLTMPIDADELNQSLAALCNPFPVEKNFSIQMRNFTEAYHFPQNLEEQLTSQGYLKNDSRPEWVLSIVAHHNTVYAGASYCADNLSDWNGGMQRFKKSEDSISRAEFKLLEALSVFDIDLSQAKTGLDLGAAPGGWSKVLLERGLKVTAVDPAALSEALAGHPNLTHIWDVAERLKPEGTYDIIVNDMRMDMMASARIMLDLAPRLSEKGVAVMTLKLPHKEWYKNTKRALKLLEKSYTVKGARQLFHNRSEVTVVLVAKSL